MILQMNAKKLMNLDTNQIQYIFFFLLSIIFTYRIRVIIF